MQLSANYIQIVKDYFSGRPVLKAYVLGYIPDMKLITIAILIYCLTWIIQRI